MPPKGWRKNPDGTYPQPNRETEITSIDEILFPKTTVVRLAKEVLPQNTLLSKDSAQALQRCATVYVNYLAENARNITVSKDRLTVTATDVVEAFGNVGLEEFVDVMRRELDEFNTIQEKKKQRKVQRKEGDALVAGNGDENDTEMKDGNGDSENAKQEKEGEEDDGVDDVVSDDEEEGNGKTESLEKEQKELEGEEPEEDKQGGSEDDNTDAE